MFVPCLGIQYLVSFLVLQSCNNLDGQERAGCFTLIVFPMLVCSV